VLFEDGATEGAKETIDDIRAIRHGRLLQTKQMLPLVQQLSEDQPSPVDAAKIHALRDKISAMPPEVNGQPAEGHLTSGMHAAQSEMSRRLAQIPRSNQPDYRNELTDLKQLLEQEVSALQQEESK
jgi:hypothetical protein